MIESVKRIMDGRQLPERPAYRFTVIPWLLAVDLDAAFVMAILEPAIDGVAGTWRMWWRYGRQGIEWTWLPAERRWRRIIHKRLQADLDGRPI